MANLGFIIPLDFNDYFIGRGQRINWCSTQQWWTNENINLTGTIDATTAKIGDSVVIQAGLQGVVDVEGNTAAAAIQNVQAWVCYPNSVPGAADQSLVVSSMQASNPAFQNLSNNPPLVFGSANASDYQDASGVSFQLISLPPWVPQAADLLGGTDVHCCIVVASSGLADADLEANPINGDPVGVFVPNEGALSADINICTDPHQGQRNMTIVGLGGMHRIGGLLTTGFSFLSGAAQRAQPATVTVEVKALNQGAQIDPALLKVLATGPFKALPLTPAAAPPKSLRLRRHEDHWEGWLAKIIHEAEEILEELLGIAEHPFGGGHRLRLRLPAQGLQPLRLDIELDAAEPVGTVHAIEITQTDPDGRVGGIRLGAVVTP